VTCNSIALLDYAHGFLGEPESAQVREHVLGCAVCRQALGRIEEEEKLLREAAEQFVPLPRSLEGRRLAREPVLSGPKGAPGRSQTQSGRRMAMAAALLLCAGISWMMLLQAPPGGPGGPGEGSAQARQEIEKLASDKPAEREAAYLKLKDMGRAAEPDLRKAVPSRDPEVASRIRRLLGRLVLVDELPAGLRKALPGIEDRLAVSQDHAWTEEFLNATELTPAGAPKNSALRREDLSALVARAVRAAQNPEERRVTADRVVLWGLRLTQYVSAEEALRCLYGSIDVEQMPLPDFLSQNVMKNGVSFVIDGPAFKHGGKNLVMMKTFTLTLWDNLIMTLLPRGMDFAPLEGLVVITPSGKPWRANSRDNVPPTPEEIQKVELSLKNLVSSDPKVEQQGYEDLVTVGLPALGPLLGALGRLEGEGALRVRAVCRKIAWDTSDRWLVDLPSGADVQKLSKAAKKLLETRIDCDPGAMLLEDLLKAKGVSVNLKAKPQDPFFVSLKGEPLGSFLKAATRSSGLDFYLDGETIVIDTQDNVCAAVER